MRYFTTIFSLLLLTLTVACGQADAPPAPATDVPTIPPTQEMVEEATAVSQPTPALTITRAPLIFDNVDEELAETYSETIRFGRALVAEGIDVEAAMLTVTVLEMVEWPDGCLGMGQPGEGCTEALVPGLRIQVSLDDQIYEIRTDLDGRQYRWITLQ